MLAAVLKAESPGAEGARWVAVMRALLFCVQTAVLDSLVWPTYYPD